MTREQLASALAAPLPGATAQYQMAPAHRPGPEASNYPPADARRAAVLILFYPDENHTHENSAGEGGDPRKLSPEGSLLSASYRIPMMLRPARTGPHSGQISFPGGAYEKNHDRDLRETALRESEEELGIRPANVEVLGALSNLYVAPSGYLVTPYVGWSERRPEFVLDPREVDQVLEIPVAHLIDPAHRKQEIRELKWGLTNVPYFSFPEHETEHKIWGASAMMLAELLAVLTVLD